MKPPDTLHFPTLDDVRKIYPEAQHGDDLKIRIASVKEGFIAFIHNKKKI